jgi:hypothetical protein
MYEIDSDIYETKKEEISSEPCNSSKMGLGFAVVDPNIGDINDKLS